MLLDINGGTSLDPQPVIQGCDFTGAADAWRAQNAAAGAVFPIVAGNRSGRCTVVGTVAPEGAVTALQGSLYVHQSGDSSELYFKASTTGPTGWQLLS
jgi:hypothetical protein